MLLNFAVCIVGCAGLALMNVASFLYGLGWNPQSVTGGKPFWLLILAAAVLPLLACVCCFYASLSTAESPPAEPVAWVPAPDAGNYPAVRTLSVPEPAIAEVVAGLQPATECLV